MSASGTVYVKVDSGTSGQLLIWFGSLVTSWDAFQRTSERQNWREFSSGVSLHTWVVLTDISCWAWPWGLSISMGLWLVGSHHLGLSFYFLIVSPTKWTKLPYFAMDFYSTWDLVVSKNEMYSWALINIYNRFWVLISMSFK